MTSDVQIANRALQKLGAGRISSLSQNHPNARSMNAAFVRVRQRALREHPWNFAIKRASVAKDGSETLYEGLNKYRKPNDFLRLLRDDESAVAQQVRHDWQIEGDFIVSADAAPLKFRYIADITDPQKYDPLFDEYFATVLALETVDEITGSNTKKRALKDDLLDLRREARRVNGMENDANEPAEDAWVSSMR